MGNDALRDVRRARNQSTKLYDVGGEEEEGKVSPIGLSRLIYRALLNATRPSASLMSIAFILISTRFFYLTPIRAGDKDIQGRVLLYCMDYREITTIAFLHEFLVNSSLQFLCRTLTVSKEQSMGFFFFFFCNLPLEFIDNLTSKLRAKITVK